MDLIKRKGEKVGPIKDVLHKIKYSFQGLAYCFKNETSFIIITLAFVAVIVMGIIFKIEFMEWVFSILSLASIMEVELLNTGIEATVDMVTEKFHPLAKIAKDCGSAATSIATFTAIAVNLIIFVPKVLPFLFK